jgi:hypothetical protein
MALAIRDFIDAFENAEKWNHMVGMTLQVTPKIAVCGTRF